jgi:hypothetical protein
MPKKKKAKKPAKRVQTPKPDVNQIAFRALQEALKRQN